mmetsp:Transcript_665/g.1100  ORF Transcript_665/g.1100 Transcript_665/m.1100 type:complete len:325 (+) Transcript_665:34-1008(+)
MAMTWVVESKLEDLDVSPKCALLDLEDILNALPCYLDAAAVCTSEATCSALLDRWGPEAAHWERACQDRWNSCWWWTWRCSLLQRLAADQCSSWQAAWFSLQDSVLPGDLELTAVLVETQEVRPENAIHQVPHGWSVVLIDLCYELSRLDPAPTITYAKQKYGQLRLSCRSHPSVQAKAQSLVHLAIDRCGSTCENCGLDNGKVEDVWGYVCVVCRPCHLIFSGQQLVREQKADGSWSSEKEVGEEFCLNFATKQAIASELAYWAAASADQEKVHSSTAVHRLLRKLVTQLLEMPGESTRRKSAIEEMQQSLDRSAAFLKGCPP